MMIKIRNTKQYKNTKKSKNSYFRKIFVVRNQRKRFGQAMLVAILIITMAALAIAMAVATVSSSEVKISYGAKQSSEAYFLTEACLENALMRLARTDNSQPSNFTTSDGACTIKITGSAPYEILATGQIGDAYRKIQATVSVSNEVLMIEKWEESY